MVSMAYLRITFVIIALLAFSDVALGIEKITIQQAVEKAKKTMGNQGWEVAFISNTGVTQSVTSEKIRKPADGLMSPDGKAGQWIVEMYQNKPITNAKGFVYPLRIFIVTANDASEIPENNLGVPRKLVPITNQKLMSFDKGLKEALVRIKKKYDVLSVASDMKTDGNLHWVFKFYNLKSGEIVDKITI